MDHSSGDPKQPWPGGSRRHVERLAPPESDKEGLAEHIVDSIEPDSPAGEPADRRRVAFEKFGEDGRLGDRPGDDLAIFAHT